MPVWSEALCSNNSYSQRKTRWHWISGDHGRRDNKPSAKVERATTRAAAHRCFEVIMGATLLSQPLHSSMERSLHSTPKTHLAKNVWFFGTNSRRLPDKTKLSSADVFRSRYNVPFLAPGSGTKLLNGPSQLNSTIHNVALQLHTRLWIP